MQAFTLLHVAISLVGIASGFVVIHGMLGAQRRDRWTAVFLLTTVLTSLTGFGFPVDHFMPSHAIGIISLVVLALAIVARYRRHLAGPWRLTYVITALAAQYLNVFVLVVQSFLKVPLLKQLAPNQNEPPFAIAQLAVLIAFAVIGFFAVKRFGRAADGPPTAVLSG